MSLYLFIFIFIICNYNDIIYVIIIKGLGNTAFYTVHMYLLHCLY